MPEAQRIYWCSNVFVHYLDATPEYIDVLDQLLLDAEQNKIEIVTSTVTLSEVAFAASEKAQGALDPSVEEAIDKLWTPPSPIRLAEYHQGIALEARDLIRQALTRGWSLKPYDANHLATARWANAQDFHTYDKVLDKYAPLVGYTVSRPTALQVGLFRPGDA